MVCEDIVKKSQQGNMDCIGSLGGTLYYGNGYMATLHRDKDATWSLSGQSSKLCRPDEYNFALVEWKVYFITRPGAVW